MASDIPSSVKETSSMVVSIASARVPISPLVEGLPQSEAPSELLLGMSQAKKMQQQQQQQKKEEVRQEEEQEEAQRSAASADKTVRGMLDSVERLRLRSRSASSDSALSDGTDSDSSSTSAV